MKRILAIILGVSIHATMAGMENPTNKITIQEKVNYSSPQYDKEYNDYTIHALLNTKKIGHITYGPSKNPYVPKGSWSIKSLRVSNDYLKNKIGLKLFLQSVENIRAQKVLTINLVAVPLIDSLSKDVLINIYLKMIKKIDPNLIDKVTIRPWPSDETYKQIIINLKKQ